MTEFHRLLLGCRYRGSIVGFERTRPVWLNEVIDPMSMSGAKRSFEFRFRPELRDCISL